MEDGEHGGDHVGGAVDEETDGSVRTEPEGLESVGEPKDALAEVTIGDGDVTEGQRGGVGGARGLCLELKMEAGRVEVA